MVKEPASVARCQYTKAAPRHFLYPALLLLLAEEASHGYRLVDALLDLGFGPFDRARVYRALGDLEDNRLVRSWWAVPTAGSMRHMYAVTETGFAALTDWMAVVDDERSLLSAVLKRYEATLGNQSDDDA